MTSEADPENDSWTDERGWLRDRIRADRETIGAAWMFAIIPAGLVLVLLNSLLGSLGRYLSHLSPVLWSIPLLGFALVPFWHLWRSDVPLDLSDGQRLVGRTKRKTLLIAGGITIIASLYMLFGSIWEARLLGWLHDALIGWRI